MRLIHAKTLKLETFSDERETPAYAILSHTWANREVLYHDLLSLGLGNERPDLDWNKIHLACEQATADFLDYAWVDTCCIDKTSSAELSEGINSMFRWYQNAAVCYAYLSDVLADETAVPFKQSRWFSRGWTLQELIAPSKVVFYDREWSFLGTKADLHTQISEATNIETSVLDGTCSLESTSVAKRMSWASKRRTTRVEDEAYCLLGIFDVNMPLLYGEGTKAFARLQEEISRVSDDHSIFAWSGKGTQLFAPSTEAFAGASSIVRVENVPESHYEATKRGVRISLKQDSVKEEGYRVGTGSVILDCIDLDHPKAFIALRVKYEKDYGDPTKAVLYPDHTVHLIDGTAVAWPHFRRKEELLILHEHSAFHGESGLRDTPVQLVLIGDLASCPKVLHPSVQWRASDATTTIQYNPSDHTDNHSEEFESLCEQCDEEKEWAVDLDMSGLDLSGLVEVPSPHLVVRFGYRNSSWPSMYLSASVYPHGVLAIPALGKPLQSLQDEDAKPLYEDSANTCSQGSACIWLYPNHDRGQEQFFRIVLAPTSVGANGKGLALVVSVENSKDHEED